VCQTQGGAVGTLCWHTLAALCVPTQGSDSTKLQAASPRNDHMRTSPPRCGCGFQHYNATLARGWRHKALQNLCLCLGYLVRASPAFPRPARRQLVSHHAHLFRCSHLSRSRERNRWGNRNRWRPHLLSLVPALSAWGGVFGRSAALFPSPFGRGQGKGRRRYVTGRARRCRLRVACASMHTLRPALRRGGEQGRGDELPWLRR